jgi:hypothetical protein
MSLPITYIRPQYSIQENCPKSEVNIEYSGNKERTHHDVDGSIEKLTEGNVLVISILTIHPIIY